MVRPHLLRANSRALVGSKCRRYIRYLFSLSLDACLPVGRGEGGGEGDKVHKVSREQELNKEGWEKRFTIDEPRLSEMVEQYKELGFEVLLEPVDISSEECTTCFTAFHDRYKTIYTRPKNDN